MANSEYIDKLVASGFHEDLAAMAKGLDVAAESMAALSDQAAELFKEFGGVASLKDMITLTKTAAAANTAMADSQAKVTRGAKLLTEEQVTNNLSIKEQNDRIKLSVQLANAQEGSIAKAILQVKEWTNELKNLNLEQDKTRQIQLTADIDAKNSWIKSNVDDLSRQKINIGNYPDLLIQMEKLKEEMAEMDRAGMRNSETFQQMNMKFRELSNSLGAMPGRLTQVTSSMSTLTSEMQYVKATAGEDSAEFRILQERFDMLAVHAAELKEQMVGVTLAIKEAGSAGERGALAMEKIGETLKEAGKFALEFFGIQLGMEFIAGISEEFEKADLAARKLKNTLDNVGSANLFGPLTKEAEEFAEKFKYLETHDIQNVFSQLITYGKLTEDQIHEAMPVIVDFAAKTGKSLEESASVIIKSLEGSSKGLKEFGINIKDAKDATGKALPQAERFSFIMEQLKPRVEGAANAFGQSFSGKIATFKKEIHEMELAIANFFVGLMRIDLENQNNAVQAKKEVDQGQALINTYEELSKKVNKTADDKKELSKITSELGGIFGNSVLKLNDETGAMELNIKMTKELIKTKSLLVETRKNELISRYKANQEQTEAVNADLEISKQQREQFSQTPGADKRVDRMIHQIADDNATLKKLARQRQEIILQFDEFGTTDELEKSAAAPSKLDPGAKIPPPPGGEKPTKDNAIDNEKALSAAMYAEWEAQVKAKAVQQKEILDDEHESYEKRKEALLEFERLQSQMNLGKLSQEYGDKQFEIANLKKNPKESDKSFQQRKDIANKELLAIDAKYNAQVIENKKSLNDALKKLDTDYFNQQLKVVKQISDTHDEQETIALKNIDEQYRKGLITFEKWEQARQDISDRYARSKLLLDQAYYKELLKKYQPGTEEYDKLKDLLAQVNAAIEKSDAGEIKKGYKRDKWDDGKQEPKQDSVGYLLHSSGVGDKQILEAQKGIELVGELQKAEKAQIEAKIAGLEREKALIDSNYDAQINAINGSMMSEASKQRYVSVLAAQKAAQDKAINDEIKREKRKEAAEDKIASIAKIIADGAAAVVKALPNYVLAGIVAATAGVELAVAAAAPLPQYGEGTPDDAVGHPGGPAIIGDKPEWVVRPGQKPYFTDKTHVAMLERGTRVIPEMDLIAGSMGFMTPSLMQNIQLQSDFTRLESAVREEIGGLKEVVKNKQENHWHIGNGELIKSTKIGNSWNTFVNKNF